MTISVVSFLFYIHPDAVNTTRCGNTWIKTTARLYKQIENVQPENDTDGIKQKIIRYCENQYTWNANSMQCNTWRRYESMKLTAGTAFASSQSTCRAEKWRQGIYTRIEKHRRSTREQS
jgi:hypothetical protein